MITDLATTLTAQLPAAAGAASQAWNLADPLTVGEPTTSADDLQLTGQAVLVEFSGPGSGELVVSVDDELAAHLMDAGHEPADLVAALEPSITAACMALGNVTAQHVQLLDPRLALQRVLALGEAAAVMLYGEDQQPKATVAVGSEPVTKAPTANRLDLLRGVKMQATVELGRTTMTINELLSLHPGAVVELDRAAGSPADLYVNGRLIARGEVVVVDENYGLRIQQVLSDDVEV